MNSRKALFFVNKKKPKNFDSFEAALVEPPVPQTNKSFLVLFFKKEHSLLSSLSSEILF